MAAQKPTLVSSLAFSTILNARGIFRPMHAASFIVVRSGMVAHFKRTHGVSPKNWDAALSLHLHGDLR